MLADVARMLRAQAGGAIVELAHMELAEPTIEQAFAACVAQGARTIVVHPYFLAPGRHSTKDIPRMSRDAAAKYPGVSVSVTEPLGIDPRMIEVILRRVHETIAEEIPTP